MTVPAAAGWFSLCGRPTADGGRCRNPAKLCTVDHKGKRYKKGGRARAVVARAEKALPPSWGSTLRQANSFNPVGSGTPGLAQTAETLDDADLTAAPPRPGSDLPDVKVTNLVALLLDQDRAGSSGSRRRPPGRLVDCPSRFLRTGGRSSPSCQRFRRAVS